MNAWCRRSTSGRRGPGAELDRGRGRHGRGRARRASANATLPKFRDGGLLLVHAGGRAGLFSAIIGGWVNGAIGQPTGDPARDPH